MAFVKAVRGKVNVKAIITGASGSGKTFTSLSIASHLVAKGDPTLVKENPMLPGGYKFSEKLAGKIAVIESENRSQEYAGGRPFWFSVEELTNFSTSNWALALSAARKQGFEVVILDSFSDEWRGKGGCCSVAESKGSTYQAWKDVKEAHWALINEIQNYPGHIIITARSKPGIDIEDAVDPKSGRVRKVPVARGLTPIQEETFPYRLSFLFDMTSLPESGAVLKVRKSVAYNLQNETEHEKPGKAFADLLLSWCDADHSSLNLFQEYRERMLQAGDKKALNVIGKEVAAAEDKLTTRQTETLREIYAIVAEELKKVPATPAPVGSENLASFPPDAMPLG